MRNLTVYEIGFIGGAADEPKVEEPEEPEQPDEGGENDPLVKRQDGLGQNVIAVYEAAIEVVVYVAERVNDAVKSL